MRTALAKPVDMDQLRDNHNQNRLRTMLARSQSWNENRVIKNDLDQEYCYVPRRPFIFGRETAPSRLLGPYYIGKYPISNDEFKSFVAQTGYEYQSFELMDRISPEPGCPAAPVSYDDARAYARWIRSILDGYYAIPNERQWELSARGFDGRVYPWGNTPPSDKHGVFSLTVDRRQTNISTEFPTNVSIFGCVNLIGNVWEWCVNLDPNTGPEYVLRGGSCEDHPELCNCRDRYPYEFNDDTTLYAGFRLLYLTEDLYETYQHLLGQQTIVHTRT